jgi:hypothetical protein
MCRHENLAYIKPAGLGTSDGAKRQRPGCPMPTRNGFSRGWTASSVCRTASSVCRTVSSVCRTVSSVCRTASFTWNSVLARLPQPSNSNPAIGESAQRFRADKEACHWLPERGQPCPRVSKRGSRGQSCPRSAMRFRAAIDQISAPWCMAGADEPNLETTNESMSMAENLGVVGESASRTGALQKLAHVPRAVCVAKRPGVRQFWLPLFAEG